MQDKLTFIVAVARALATDRVLAPPFWYRLQLRNGNALRNSYQQPVPSHFSHVEKCPSGTLNQ